MSVFTKQELGLIAYAAGKRSSSIEKLLVTSVENPYIPNESRDQLESLKAEYDKLAEKAIKLREEAPL